MSNYNRLETNSKIESLKDIEDIKNNQMENLEPKNTITKIKKKLNG